MVNCSFMLRFAIPAGQRSGYYEVVLRESRRVVRMDRGVLITETHHGLICANSGVDESNVDGGGVVTLLPKDSDASAAALRVALRERLGGGARAVAGARAWDDVARETLVVYSEARSR